MADSTSAASVGKYQSVSMHGEIRRRNMNTYYLTFILQRS